MVAWKCVVDLTDIERQFLAELNKISRLISAQLSASCLLHRIEHVHCPADSPSCFPEGRSYRGIEVITWFGARRSRSDSGGWANQHGIIATSFTVRPNKKAGALAVPSNCSTSTNLFPEEYSLVSKEPSISAQRLAAGVKSSHKSKNKFSQTNPIFVAVKNKIRFLPFSSSWLNIELIEWDDQYRILYGRLIAWL